jgi:hypothetical protein
MSVLLSGVPPSLGFAMVGRRRTIGVGELAVTQPAPEGAAVLLILRRRVILGRRDLPPPRGAPLTTTPAADCRRKRCSTPG